MKTEEQIREAAEALKLSSVIARHSPNPDDSEVCMVVSYAMLAWVLDIPGDELTQVQILIDKMKDTDQQMKNVLDEMFASKNN